MTISVQQLQSIMPYIGARAPVFAEPLGLAMSEFDITGFGRSAPFIAQLAHESGEFRYMREIADGSAYEGRLDLGNTEPGDGRHMPRVRCSSACMIW